MKMINTGRASKVIEYHMIFNPFRGQFELVTRVYGNDSAASILGAPQVNEIEEENNNPYFSEPMKAALKAITPIPTDHNKDLMDMWERVMAGEDQDDSAA